LLVPRVGELAGGHERGEGRAHHEHQRVDAVVKQLADGRGHAQAARLGVCSDMTTESSDERGSRGTTHGKRSTNESNATRRQQKYTQPRTWMPSQLSQVT
jgi:hypothetical protein